MINKLFYKIGFYAVVSSFLLGMTTSLAYAYGGGGRVEASCTPARITKENPAPKAVIPKLANFSFVASSNTLKSSLAVKIRDQEGVIDKITQQPHGGYLVEGHLPEPITGEKYARIDVLAETNRGCPTQHHYLVQISEEAENQSMEKEEEM